jgi:hypothetical protein
MTTPSFTKSQPIPTFAVLSKQKETHRTKRNGAILIESRRHVSSRG